MLFGGVAGVVQQFAIQMTDGASDLNGFMNVVTDPGGCRAVIKTDFAIWVPAGMSNPSALVSREAREVESNMVDRAGEERLYFGGEFVGDFFVGVD